MYIELFLLDNLLMNLLIVRLAAALLSVRPPLYLQTAVSLLTAVYAAAAAYLWPLLGRPPLRPLMLAVMALALPFTGVKGYLTCCAATLFAALAAGGAAFCTALIMGGGIEGGFIKAGVPLRTALIAALAVSLLPRAARAVQKRRLSGSMLAQFTVEHKGLRHRFTALVDTGNRLSEPVTGLPVAVVACPALKRYAYLPVRIRTAAGEHTLYAFRPERAVVDGESVNCLVAVTEARKGAEAVIPPELCRPNGAKGGALSFNANNNTDANIKNDASADADIAE